MRDGVPAPLQHYLINQQWITALQNREWAIAKSQDRMQGSLVDDATRLLQLSIGTPVCMQDVTSKVWDRLSMVMGVKLDGSGCLSLRNQRHPRPQVSLIPMTLMGQGECPPAAALPPVVATSSFRWRHPHHVRHHLAHLEDCLWWFL